MVLHGFQRFFKRIVDFIAQLSKTVLYFVKNTSMKGSEEMTSEEIPLAETLTSTEARKKMQISPHKLRSLIDAGELHTYPDPRHKQMKRIPIAEIDAWLKQAGPPIKHARREETEQI